MTNAKVSKYALKNGKTALTGFADLGEATGILPVEIDMAEVFSALGSEFAAELGARDESIKLLDEEMDLRKQISVIQESLISLRDESKNLGRMIETAEFAVDKAFNENNDLRAQSLWMRENNRAAEWDAALKVQKLKAVKKTVGENVYFRWIELRETIQVKMSNINVLDQKAIAAHVDAETIKRNAGFKTKAVK